MLHQILECVEDYMAREASPCSVDPRRVVCLCYAKGAMEGARDKSDARRVWDLTRRASL